ncbi:MAG: M15 family metallopeptidase [Ruminococcus sp.]|nr:M15 family metallopeptidase [Ruminococcus sp.]
MNRITRLTISAAAAALTLSLSACGTLTELKPLNPSSLSDSSSSSKADSSSADSSSDDESSQQEKSDDSSEEKPDSKEESSSEIVETVAEDGVTLSNDSSDFVLLSEAVPDAILEMRYYSTYNFVGERIDGYEEPVAFLTKEAADALKEVSDELKEQGYRLKIYDAYRPQSAVDHFIRWAQDSDDTKMKDYFYPDLDKESLFPEGYAHSGNSRGSTVDVTLFDVSTQKDVDMGGTFDYFGEISRSDYVYITEEQYANRELLANAMKNHGFEQNAEEWWHFTLSDEPFTDTYFTFPVNSDSAVKN